MPVLLPGSLEASGGPPCSSMNSQCTHLLSPALSPPLSSTFPHMWMLWRLPGSQASAVGKAPRTGAWTTQVVRRLMWNVGESEAGPHCCMACPIRGRGIFGAMREMQTDSPSSHERPWKHGVGVGVATHHQVSIRQIFLESCSQCKHYQSSSKPNMPVREAQEKSREEVESIKLLR